MWLVLKVKLGHLCPWQNKTQNEEKANKYYMPENEENVRNVRDTGIVQYG